MANQDISRFLHQPDKHYSSVHIQQGRVIIDSDWNDRAAIEAEDLRATLLDMVCSQGSSNEGMKVTSAAEVTSSYDFELGVGSYYLGGLRLAVEPDERFLSQRDWLQVDSDGANLPAQVADASTRTDLVYVHAWEQAVTAVEDSELLEVALGGRDAGTRMKRMRRFVVMTNVDGTDCDSAFTSLKTALTSNGASFDVETGELLSSGRLQVTTTSVNQEEDLCAEPSSSGYVGADNQTLRVEIRDATTFVWGRDNAAKLYRVLVDPDFVTLTILNPPEDVHQFPRAGQTVELLRWGAILPNLEKVAEPQGELDTVATTYNPSTGQLVLTTGVDSSWLTWLDDLAHADYLNPKDNGAEDDFRKYIYLRVWDGGALNYDTLNPAPVALGSTGLEVTLTGTPEVGDYWIISARPSTPEVVTPWNLADAGGAPPHGPRRFYAPLAMIDWDGTPNPADAVLTDCRTQLRRLCEGGCCTVTVGDGQRSHGQVNSLQDALDIIGVGPGKICLLPGVHEGGLVLDQVTGVTIEGCGPRTELRAPAPSSSDPATADAESFYGPVLTIRDSTDVRVRDLRITAHSAVGVMIDRVDPNSCEDILLENLEIFATGQINVPDAVLELPAPCVAVQGASDVVVRGCSLEMDAVGSLSMAVVFAGDRLRLLDSHVTAPIFDGVELTAPGGVQIRSQSTDIDVIGCTIEGGWGHGIALGHAEIFPRGSSPLLGTLEIQKYAVGAGKQWLNPGGKVDCIEPKPGGGLEEASDTTNVWLPTGPVENVRIHDNVIRKMGQSGISTYAFFASAYDWETNNPGPVFIVAINLDIARNQIEDNVQISQLPEAMSVDYDRCVGGLCLAAAINAVIRENHIVRNGTGNHRVPTCGVGIVAAQNVVIEDNLIADNGAMMPTGEDEPKLLRGLRGGIAVQEVSPVLGYTFKTEVTTGPDLPDPVTDLSGTSQGSALVVRGNEVSQPVGKALWVRRAFGPITVSGNSLASFGDPVDGDSIPGVSLRWKHASAGNLGMPIGGACVEIIDLGLAMDRSWSGELPSPDWVDTSGTSIAEGNVLVTGNTFSLDWQVLGGHAFCVLISTLGSLVYNANSTKVTTENPYGDTIPFQYASQPIKSLLEDVVTGFDSMSFLFASSYLGAASTVQASGNRLEEGQTDCLFSLIAGSAIVPPLATVGALKNGASVIGNVGTHCCVSGLPSITEIQLGNIAVYTNEDFPGDCGRYDINELELGGIRVVQIKDV